MNEKIDFSNIENLYPPDESNCLICDKYNPINKLRCCLAFPDGIPEEIWSGKNLHLTPYQGDNGIQFGNYFHFVPRKSE